MAGCSMSPDEKHSRAPPSAEAVVARHHLEKESQGGKKKYQPENEDQGPVSRKKTGVSGVRLHGFPFRSL